MNDNHASADWFDRLSPGQLPALNESLTISAKQIDEGDYAEFNVEQILAEGKARRAERVAAAAE